MKEGQLLLCDNFRLTFKSNMLQEVWKKKENGSYSEGTMESLQDWDAAGEEVIRKSKKHRMERE